MIDSVASHSTTTALVSFGHQDHHGHVVQPKPNTSMKQQQPFYLPRSCLKIPVSVSVPSDLNKKRATRDNDVSSLVLNALQVITPEDVDDDLADQRPENNLLIDEDYEYDLQRSSSLSSSTSSSSSSSSTFLASPTTTQRKQQSRVHLNLDANRVFDPTLVDGLTVEDVLDAWYDEEEWDVMFFRYENQLEEGQTAEQWHKDLHRVANMCHQLGVVTNKGDWETCVGMLARNDEAVLHRGLEAEVIPLWQRWRDRHRRNVLEFATHLQAKELSQDMKDRMIAARSMQFSQTHKMMAQVLAQADAMVVE